MQCSTFFALVQHFFCACVQLFSHSGYYYPSTGATNPLMLMLLLLSCCCCWSLHVRVAIQFILVLPLLLHQCCHRFCIGATTPQISINSTLVVFLVLFCCFFNKYGISPPFFALCRLEFWTPNFWTLKVSFFPFFFPFNVVYFDNFFFFNFFFKIF